MTHNPEDRPTELLESNGEDDPDGPEGADEGELSGLEPTGVLLEKSDRSLSEFHRWYTDGRLILDPEWQRHYVWNRKRASRLIESFLIDLPVPVVYLAKSEDGSYEVIDGLQRLNSVFEFLDGKLILDKLEILSDLNGKAYRDLDSRLQRKLQDATLRAYELSPRTQKDLLFVVFERLNTGGVALNDMEIRNCLFRGKLNAL